jgi:pSer/pThr/pTyr-binding forkhead associated (FHA) protein
MMKISVVDGAPEETLEFDEETVSIGRSRHNTLVLEDKTLSRTHCEIAAVNGRFLVINHAKTNGTCVNGQPVGEAFLKPGDEIMVGRVTLRFDGSDEADGGSARPTKRARKSRRVLAGKADPVLLAIAYVAGVGLSPLVWWVLR